MRDLSSGSDEAGLAPVRYLSEARSASSAVKRADDSRGRTAGPRFGDAPSTSTTEDPRPSEANGSPGDEPETVAPGEIANEAVVTSFSGIPFGADEPENEPETVERAVVEQRVLRALGRKALSEKEVRALIDENGLDGPEVEEIVDRLTDLRYVDDRILAEELTRRLSEGKGQSKSAVGRALSARGIPADIVSEALDEIDDGEERRVAFEIAEKRARQMGSLDAQTLERRLSGFLARRGYPGGLVRDIVSDIAKRRPSGAAGPRFR